MIIPSERISADVLDGIIESYVLREGTDYGESELSMDEKVSNLRVQIKRGDVVVVYDESTETVNLLPKEDILDQM